MKNQFDKENVHWTPSSTVRRAQAPERPRRKFVLIAIPSTLVVCGIAAGLVVVGMNQKQGEGLVEATKAVTAALAQPEEAAGATKPGPEEKVTSPRVLGEDGSGQRDVSQNEAPQPLSQQHPRWAKQAEAKVAASDNGQELKRKLVRLGHEDMHPRSARTASLARDAWREKATASIPGQTAYAEMPDVDAGDEVAALEAIMAPEEPKPESGARAEEGGPEPMSWEEHAANLKAASATDAVHLRAQPGKDADILTVVPKGASVKAEGDCTGWCAVSYNGSKGWVYKDYVRFAQSAASHTAAQVAPGATTSAPQEPAATEEPLPAPTHAPTALDRTRNAR